MNVGSYFLSTVPDILAALNRQVFGEIFETSIPLGQIRTIQSRMAPYGRNPQEPHYAVGSYNIY